MYAAAGIFTFPLKDKNTPLVKWGSEATTDPATISRWARRWPDAWLGIAAKPSGLLVVDLDTKHPPINGIETWAQLTLAAGDPEAAPACYFDRTTLIRTTSGALHLWFADTEGIPGRNDMLPGVDVKGAEGTYGGFVVAPPSPAYELLGLKPPMKLPDWLALVLSHDDKPNARDPHTYTQGSIAGTSGLLSWLGGVQPGGQDEALCWAVRALRDKGLSPQEAGDLLWPVVSAWPCSAAPWTTDDIERHLRSAYGEVPS
ncbi:bifunctional DNA primase/polymerase [Streptomyces sp. NBC_00885]|nr:bifunctional DNA primase/polymerase [Streptomyces sp. NBC_00885]